MDVLCIFFFRMRVWHKVSTRFNTPRASLLVSIYAPFFTASLRAAVLGEIFVKLLHDSLNETLYMASVADIEASIVFAGDRIEISVAGFSHKIFSILEVIISSMFDLKIQEDRLSVITGKSAIYTGVTTALRAYSCFCQYQKNYSASIPMPASSLYLKHHRLAFIFYGLNLTTLAKSQCPWKLQ